MNKSSRLPRAAALFVVELCEAVDCPAIGTHNEECTLSRYRDSKLNILGGG